MAHRLDFDIAPAQLQRSSILWAIPSTADEMFPFRGLPICLGVHTRFQFIVDFRHLLENSIFQINGESCSVVCVLFPSRHCSTFISELGNTMNDNVTTLFVLGAVPLDCGVGESGKTEHRPYFIYVGLEGLIMASESAPPSIAIFALSTAFGFSVLQTSWRNKAISLLSTAFRDTGNVEQ
jgi:hypothetical protein